MTNCDIVNVTDKKLPAFVAKCCAGCWHAKGTQAYSPSYGRKLNTKRVARKPGIIQPQFRLGRMDVIPSKRFQPRIGVRGIQRGPSARLLEP
jgi:hypothetical protein